MQTSPARRKVVIVGAGAVGATFAFALAQKGIAEEIVLNDVNVELARGQALDLAHGYPFYPPARIREGSARDYADAQLIVITAGAKQKPGEARLALLRRNAGIIQTMMDAIAASGSSAVVVMVSNPVDILTHVALQRLQWPRGRVIGSGTVLDSARMRYLLSHHCGVDVRNVHAYILGEHGDSEFAAWSHTHIAGMPIDVYCPLCRGCVDWREERKKIEQEVRDSAYHIIDYKGATCYAIGMALVRIASAVLRNEKSVLTVSTLLNGEYDLEDVCLSVPCLVGAGGIERIISVKLADEEHRALERSAAILKATLASLDQT